MRIFLAIYEGPTVQEAKALAVTEDARVIDAAVRELTARLTPIHRLRHLQDLNRKLQAAEREAGR